MRVFRLPGSKRVIGPTPLLPASSADQVACTPVPSGVTRPRPVTTTRLPNMSVNLGHLTAASVAGPNRARSRAGPSLLDLRKDLHAPRIVDGDQPAPVILAPEDVRRLTIHRHRFP